jgi:hypothetical protein
LFIIRILLLLLLLFILAELIAIAAPPEAVVVVLLVAVRKLRFFPSGYKEEEILGELTIFSSFSPLPWPADAFPGI